LIRGLRTLPARLDRITETTGKMIAYLEQHAKVERILFPLHPSFPQYELAKNQMKGACGLIGFYIKANTRQQIVNFCESMQHIMMAVSWGGHESLILPKCAALNEAEFDRNQAEHRLLRLYVGLEDANYLIGDLEQAFTKSV